MLRQKNHFNRFSFFFLACLFILSGCQSNPFQAKIFTGVYHQDTNKLLDVDLEETDDLDISGLMNCSKRIDRAFILIHGIYGDSETFGNLSRLLQEDYSNSCILMFSYWSSRISS